jgi:membrane-associated phospholipid phosphatase
MNRLKFSIIDILNLLFVFVIFLFYLAAFPATPYEWQPPIILLLLTILVLFAVYVRTSKKTPLADTFLFSYPVIFLFSIFETFFMILPYFNTSRYDDLLNKLDFTLLGTYPTVWIEQFHHPLFTDLLYLLYLFYFPMPLFLLVYLYKKKRFDDLDKVVFAYLSTYYISYIIYFFVPALGPRFNETLTGLQTIKQLDGIVLAVPIRELINFLEPNKFDAFPSLHTAILTITMLGCYYYHRKLFKIFIPVAIGILISLVYCRYHYVVDMIAGFIIAVTSYYVSGFLYGILKRKTGMVPFVK